MTILAIVSGKGGTGKTTVSVALSHELSKSGPVLLVDLDFFNRGLTGLFVNSKTDSAANPLLESAFAVREEEGTPTPSGWEVVSIDNNLSCARCLRAPFDDMTTQTAKSGKLYLDSLIQSVVDSSCFEFLVFDCHGGPDPFSLAACQVATHGIVVSEPDRYSLYGTLSFVRMLKKAASPCCNLGMVFNRVSPEFSAAFLLRFYMQYLANVLNNGTLLAVVPSEDFIPKVVGRYPVPTKLYPFSLLARKMAVLVYELLGERPGISRLVRWRIVRAVRFRANGKRSPAGNLYRLVSVLLVIVFLTAAIDAVRLFFDETSVDALLGEESLVRMSITVSFTGVVLGLMFAAVLGRWIQWASDTFTVLVRTHHAVRAMVPLAGVFIMAAGSTLMLGGMARAAVVAEEVDSALQSAANVFGVPVWALGLLGGALMFPMLAMAVRGTAALWEECVRCLQTMGDRDTRWELVGRAIVVIGAGAAGVAAWWG